MMLRRSIAAVLATSAALACAGGQTATPPPEPAPTATLDPEPSPPPPSDEPGDAAPTDTPPAPDGGASDQTRCSRDDECVKVVTTCCDECNGGTAIAVNRAHAGSVQRAPCAPGTGCTKRGCTTLVACEAGSCVIKVGI